VSLLGRVYGGLIAFSLLGTAGSKVSGFDPGLIAPFASALTIAVGIAWAFEEQSGDRVLLGGATVVALGAFIELLGLRFGFPFGRYVYTEAWRPVLPTAVGPFPLLLPFAWLMLTAGSARMLQNAVAAGLLAAGVDLVMEPTAVNVLGYWRWLDGGPLPGGVPVLNFFGWWAVSSVGAHLLARHGFSSDGRGIGVLAGHLTLMGGLALLDFVFGK
jgi:putative membrane protein